MPSLLLTLALLAADPLAARVFAEINAVREVPVLASKSLANAAEIESEWFNWATKHRIAFADHTINTAWTLDRYPNLLWDRLYATFPDGLPQTLSAHDVARLCGWTGGAAYDIAYIGKARASNIVAGWARSPTHSRILFGDFDSCGVGTAGGGNVWVVAIFGNQE